METSDILSDKDSVCNEVTRWLVSRLSRYMYINLILCGVKLHGDPIMQQRYTLVFRYSVRL